MTRFRVLLVSLALLALAQSAQAQIQSEFYVPVPENEAREVLDDVNSSAVDPVQTYLSITIPSSCVVYYDHWEDGYEVALDAPVQGSTRIWGNGNDPDGVPPGFGSDPNPIGAGTVLVLSNAVSTGMASGDEDPNAPGADATLQGTIDYDGRDRVGLTCASAMTRAAWAAGSGTLNAGAVEVWATSDLGTDYELPIGQNTPNSSPDFEIANISILAIQDNTDVDIDHDADGVVDISVTLNQGETYYVDSSSRAVNIGATISATGKVQVHLMTGDQGSTYAARWYTILPVSSWDSCYTTPTNSQSGADPTRVFLYNPNGSAIDVNTVDGTGAVSTLSVAAGESADFDMPSASVGVEICSDDGSPFYAGASVDHGTRTHDWGHALVPVELQTNQLLVPWADGCDPTISCTENGSPVWVTPVCDTYIYADFDQDGTPDEIDLNGDGDTNDTVDGLSEAASDNGLFVSRLDRILLHDPTDGSQTGAFIYSLDAAGNTGNMGCDLAGVWGQNGAVASGGSPAIDVGTLVVPFGADVVIEKATNGEDADTEPQAVLIPAGDSVTWTYEVTNTGDTSLGSVTVTDDQLLPNDISCDGSVVGDGADGNGDNVIGLLYPGETAICTASGVAAGGRYTNLATVVGTPMGSTGLPVLLDVTDDDPSNYYGYTGSIEIVKELIPATDPGLFDLQLGGVTGAADVGDGGATGALPVDPGTYAVGELGGTGTSLAHYGSEILCVETVGRCAGDSSVACLDDSFCDTTCDLTDYIVASCTSCTSLDVDVPAAQSEIVCAVTNTSFCDGVVCDDGLFCNGAEICEPTTGACVSGTPVDCDDGVACTNDACDESADQCVSAPDDSVCGDGAYCNGVETCDPTGGCQAGTPVDCADGVACTSDVCDEALDQCVQTSDDAACSDGAYCNGVETCDPINDCQPGTPVACGDGVSCTDDTCDEASDQCVNTPNDSACSDGAFCNGTETCDPTTGCQPGTAPNCDDGVSCTDDTCDEGSDQCVSSPDDSVCSDGAFCNGTEICDATSDCQAGTAPDCDDGVSCTNDSCDEGIDQCVSTPDDAVCDDGAYCNGVEMCDATNDCQAGAAVDCGDAVSCTVDTCDEASDQCVNAPDDSVCNDGAFCNGAETCDPTNDCQVAPPPNCDDGVACTVDSCDEGADVCANAPDDVVCDDGAICTLDVCDPTLGCQNPVDAAACGNECDVNVAKGADPIVVAGSGDVTFTFSVTNVTVPGRDLTLTSLSDDVYGDLQGLGDCPTLPVTLMSGETLTCSTVQTVFGPTGEFHVNTVTAEGLDSVSALACSETAQAAVDIVAGEIEPACRHACHVRIKFRQTLGTSTKPDFFRMNGSLDLPSDFDGTQHDFTLTISNANGVVHTETIPAGQMQAVGSKFAFKDKAAKNLGGVSLLRVWPYRVLGNWRFKVQSFGDFSLATDPDMTITVQIGPYTFTHSDTWDELKKGWQLRFNL